MDSRTTLKVEPSEQIPENAEKTSDEPMDTTEASSESAVKSEGDNSVAPTAGPAATSAAAVIVKVDSSVVETVAGEDNKGSANEQQKDKVVDEKVEGQKAEGDSEQLEVLVDDTQNDLDADLINSQNAAKTEGTVVSETKTAGDGKDDAPASGEKTEGGEAGKTDAAKSGEGETKTDDKKPDEKRLVGFVCIILSCIRCSWLFILAITFIATVEFLPSSTSPKYLFSQVVDTDFL